MKPQSVIAGLIIRSWFCGTS